MSNHQLTATTALDYLRLGKLSAVELLQDCLKQIAAREPVVGAWEYINPDDALQQAEQRDAMQSLSKVAASTPRHSNRHQRYLCHSQYANRMGHSDSYWTNVRIRCDRSGTIAIGRCCNSTAGRLGTGSDRQLGNFMFYITINTCRGLCSVKLYKAVSI